MPSSEKKSNATWTPYVGDKVHHKAGGEPGEVTGLGPEVEWPGKGTVRKVYWTEAGPVGWDWNFSLEAW